MKHYLLLLTVLFNAACQSQQRPELSQKETTFNGLTLTARCLRTFYNSYEKPVKYTRLLDTLRDKRFEVGVSLRNSADSIMSFWIMSCSQVDNLMLNNEDFYIYFEGCDKNIPEMKVLKPNDSFVLTVILLRKLPADSLINDSLWINRKMKQTKIGFVFADASTLKGDNEYVDFMKDKSRWNNVIWSNELALEAEQ